VVPPESKKCSLAAGPMSSWSISIRSPLRQPCLTEAIEIVLGILCIFEGHNPLHAFNCEVGINPQYLGPLCPSLIESPKLRIGGRQPGMDRPKIRRPRGTFA
jgi:hypothetical protein